DFHVTGVQTCALPISRDKGVPFSLSTVSSNSLEEVAAAVPDGELWFQLYWLNDDEIQNDLLRRAEAAGVRTLLLTSDAVLIGNQTGRASRRARRWSVA